MDSRWLKLRNVERRLGGFSVSKATAKIRGLDANGEVVEAV